MAARYSDEWKRKIAESVRKSRAGKSISEETRKKLSEAGKKGNKVKPRKPFDSLHPKTQKEKLFEERGRKCEVCGWNEVSINGTIPVEIHHLNGDHEDNRKVNLQILCPNHHRLVTEHNPFGRKGPAKPHTLKRYAAIRAISDIGSTSHLQ